MKTAVFSQERRQDIRYSLVGEIPARMINLVSEQELTFLTIDISTHGLGLLVSPSPEQGQRIRLDFLDQGRRSLEFIVRHVHLVMDEPMPGFEGMRRCGLEVSDSQRMDLDLIQLFGSFDSIMIGD